MTIERPLIYRPAGALGFMDRDAVVQLRLNETMADVRPVDAAGALAELDPANSGTGVLTMPTVVDGVLGRARLFDGVANGLAAVDASPGASLLTRDLSIQIVLAWDIPGQSAVGHPGNIVSRGLGTSAAEVVCYGLQLDVVDVPSFTGQARWLWQDPAGVTHLQAGGQFVCQQGSYTMLTATRRWVSPTQVRLRYYLGEALLAEVISANGAIGGGTTGTFELGTRMVGGVDALFFAGAIDELLIVDREMCAEEIETTWLRLTVYQPRGQALYFEMHDPGYPLPTDPGSDAMLDVRIVGHALGAAASRTEDLRANFLPQRAYGQNLDDWETVTRPLPTQNGSIEDRRERVLARLRQRRGCSIPGLKDLLAGLIGGADVDQLEFLAFSNTWVDSFATGALNTLRWDRTGNATFTAVTELIIASADALQHPAPSGWDHIRRPVDGNAAAAHQIVQLRVLDSHTNSEAGIYFGDAGHGNYILFGLRDVGPSLHVWTETFVGGVSVSSVDRGSVGFAGGTATPVWLWLYQTTTPGTWQAAWSFAATSGYSAPFTIAHPTIAHWAGIYLRTVGPVTGTNDAHFENHMLRATEGASPMNAYVLLDQALGFKPDVGGARTCVEAIAHGFVHGTFITQPMLLAGDPDTGAGVAPCGGY
jgi:hypothetical protein